MNIVRKIAATFLCGAVTTPAISNTLTVNSVADNGPGDCMTVCTLRDAIATALSGDTIEFGIDPPGTIELNGTPLNITTPLSIVGPGADLLSVSANNQSRVANVSAVVTISGLTMRDGNVIGAMGMPGGTVGQAGQSGGSALGACVYVSSGGALTLSRAAVFSCAATGGMGGIGANGSIGASSGSRGGAGGAGGVAFGAVYSLGELSIVESSITGCTLTGGSGGTGGGYGENIGAMNYFPAGNGGFGGRAGGGVYVATGSVLISNSTIGNCTVTGGVGGSAGFRAANDGGISGKGGAASAGSLFVSTDASQSQVEFSTLTGNTVTGGAGGSYPFMGMSGAVSADVLYTAIESSVSASIVASMSANPDCAGAGLLDSHGANFDQNSTCNGFTLHGSVAHSLGLLSAGIDGTFSYMPVYGGAVVDAASSCILLNNSTLTVDQHGTTRPQGLACDLGAIEADYIFVDGLE
jgi:CSLREA domain-containing protein